MGHHDWNAAIDCGGFTAVGGVDIDAGSRAAFTNKTGAPAFVDFTKALATIDADAALIASMVHFLGFTIPGIKSDLAAAGIRVRLETGDSPAS